MNCPIVWFPKFQGGDHETDRDVTGGQKDGHRKLAEYDSEGQLKRKETEKTAVQSQSRHISSKTGKALRATPPCLSC